VKGWLTITEAAKAAGCSRDTIKRHLRDGKLPNARRLQDVNQTWQIPLADLAQSGLTGKLARASSGWPAQRDTSPTQAAAVRAHASAEAASLSTDAHLRMAALEADLRVAQALAEERAAHIADLQLALSAISGRHDPKVA